MITRLGKKVGRAAVLDVSPELHATHATIRALKASTLMPSAPPLESVELIRFPSVRSFVARPRLTWRGAAPPTSHEDVDVHQDENISEPRLRQTLSTWPRTRQSERHSLVPFASSVSVTRCLVHGSPNVP